MPSFRRPSLLWPLVIIGLGALLLLQNLGLLPAGLWAALAQLWPALLILVGLDMLIGRRASGGGARVIVLVALVVAAAVALLAYRASQLPGGEQQTLVQTTDGAAQHLAVSIEVQAGDLLLSALGPSDHLMEGMVRNGPGESIRQSYSVSQQTGQLALVQDTNVLLAPFTAGAGRARWDIHLAQHIPLTLSVNTSTGTAGLDLTGLALTTFDLNTGIGQTWVIFPMGVPAQAHVRTGLGATSLSLPGDIPVRLTVKSGLANVQLPARLAGSGDTYTSPGFTTAAPFLDLELSASLGSVTVK